MSHVYLQWQAKEYHKQEKSRIWYLGVALLLGSIILYALFTNNPIVAVTFILIGVVGFLVLEKDPDLTNFAITDDGIQTGSELHPYEHINSFWVFYEPEGKQYISIHTQADLLPYVKVPLGETDPNEVRNTLLQYLPEKKHQEGLIDILGDFF